MEYSSTPKERNGMHCLVHRDEPTIQDYPWMQLPGFRALFLAYVFGVGKTLTYDDVQNSILLG